jgi:hypothetical protein
MIKYLICLILGHKFVSKAFTGETMEITNYLGQKLKTSLYEYQQSKFCLRCGKPNKNIIKENKA